jgi:hypothetical protein
MTPAQAHRCFAAARAAGHAAWEARSIRDCPVLARVVVDFTDARQIRDLRIQNGDPSRNKSR